MTDLAILSSTGTDPVATGAEPATSDPPASPFDLDDLVARWQQAGGRPPRRAGRAARVAVVAVIVALVAGLAWTGWQAHAASTRDADGRAAMAAATSDATALATYDYGHLDAFLASVKAFSTPGFASSFTKGASSLTKILQQYKATSKGKVLSAGVKRLSGATATVLVVVSQSVANTAAKAPSTQTEAFDYGLVHRSGRWLLDSATAVGS